MTRSLKICTDSWVSSSCMILHLWVSRWEAAKSHATWDDTDQRTSAKQYSSHQSRHIFSKHGTTQKEPTRVLSMEFRAQSKKTGTLSSQSLSGPYTTPPRT